VAAQQESSEVATAFDQKVAAQLAAFVCVFHARSLGSARKNFINTARGRN
jgi:hypothetical protein